MSAALILNNPQNMNADTTGDLQVRAKQFLKDLFAAPSHAERAAQMVYGLSFANNVGDNGGIDDTSLLPLTEMMRAQLEHASKVGRYTHRYSRLVNQGDAVLDHTWDEEVVLEEAVAMHSSNESLAEIASRETCNSESRQHEKYVPKTLQDALLPSNQARVITEASAPFRISHVNSAWEKMCGYSNNECRGESLSIIQGPETDMSAITALMNQLLHGEACGLEIVNYKKDGTPFRNRLNVAPLRDEETGVVTNFIGVLQDLSSLSSYIQSEQVNRRMMVA